MADSIIQLPVDGSGKKVDTENLTVGANSVERERHQIAGASALQIASVINSAPTSEYGLVTRNIPSGTQNSRLSDGTNTLSTLFDADTGAGSQFLQGVLLKVPASGGASDADYNSGVKSAATLRVVIATDQPSLTNKLLVTPDSVALPANQSVDLSRVAGTATDVNSGVKSAGTIRVVIATDQPALTNKLLVTPDSVALPANQSVDMSRIAGTASAVNSGVKDNGTLRVVLATDQPALTNSLLVSPISGQAGVQGNTGVVTALTQRVVLATDIALPAGTNAIGKLSVNSGVIIGDVNVVSSIPGTGATNLGKAEDAAHTSADVGVMVLGVRQSAPTDMSAGATDGDYEPIQISRDGAQWISGVAAHKGGWSVATGTIGATKTDIGTANTTGQVGGWYFYNSNSSVAYVQFFNTQASGVTLGTTAPVYSLGIPATSGANIPPGMVGIAHATAISIAITTTRSGSTGPTNTVDYNIWYKQ